MAHDDQTYAGYENGLDWITDLAIEDYQLNKKGITKKGITKKGVDDDKKSKSHDPRRSPGRSNL